MITSKEDLLLYLACDKKALNIKRRRPKFLGDEIWRYQIALRKHEYYTNVKCWGGGILRRYWHFIHKFYGLLLGFTIHINTIEEGLCIHHYGSIVIGSRVKIGKWCKIHSCVNIGQHRDVEESPTIGDNCFIGPGAKLFGKIKVGDNVSIGANAVVNKSFEENNIVLAGVPAKIVGRHTKEMYS